MSISATSLPSAIGTGVGANPADLATPPGDKSLSMVRFDTSMARAQELGSQNPMVQPVAFFAPEAANAPQAINATPGPESFFLAQATPADVPQTTARNNNAAQPTAPAELKATNPISGSRSVDLPVDVAAIKAPTTGQGIIDGLSRLRGVFDSQEQAITGISATDTAGTRLTNSSELINLQLEVVKYSMLMDVTSKLAGKSTQTFDTLMKGQ